MVLRHLRFLKRRTVWLLVTFAVLYVLIAGRLFYIQVLNNERYCELAERLRVRQLEIPASRGSVYDRVGRELATNVPAFAVYVQPKKIKDRERVAPQLASLTGLEESAVVRAINTGGTFAYVGRQLPVGVSDKVQEANLPAVGVLRETKRVYPSRSLCAHVLGFTDIDGRGLEGIERVANKQLAGRNGHIVAEIDSNGRVIPETRRGSVQPVDGNDVVLTIDAYLQHAAEDALAKSFESHSAAGATAVVLDPHTGEILALANCPTFDPNDRRGVQPGAWRNRAVTDLYEPGSTLKLLTVAAGLEEGIPPTEVIATCTNGGIPIGRRRIRCSLHHPYMAGHGGVDMFKIIRHSCNIGAASIALRLGPDKLYAYEKAFGLQDQPGSGMPGEAPVLPLGSPEAWPAIRLANIGFGQGVAVSALQMASAYAVIANGGNLMSPQIIREVRAKDGTVVRSFSPKLVRRVVSEETARKATEMLIGCVNEGTGKTSKIDGYSVAGKTGSAQKASTTGRGYAAGKFVASFMGFVPARNPRLVICVVVDEPKGTHWGATVAAPVYKEIAQKAMWYLKVPPDEPLKEDQTSGSNRMNVRKVNHRIGAGNTG
ncbi:MAG: penicillin-binding protein 2 [Armatimonadetes bacterium]|nr:penicillin-binding protein 2 [Armatimonadota bacterium]